MVGKRARCWVLPLVLLVAVVTGGLLAAALVVLPSLDSVDDGPFQGEVAGTPGGEPDSRVAADALILSCYNRRGAAPVIVSARRDGGVIGAWALSTGRPGDQVYQCSLTRLRRQDSGYEACGSVVWSHGHERIRLYLDADGKLLRFYLSW